MMILNKEPFLRLFMLIFFILNGGILKPELKSIEMTKMGVDSKGFFLNKL